MLQFCPDNQTLSRPWVNNGLNRCFADTISTSVLSILILLPGLGTAYRWRKRSRPIEPSLRSNSRWWTIQQILCYCIPIVLFTQLIVYAFMRAAEHIYGFMLFELIMTPLAWFLSIRLMNLECTRFVIGRQSRRHSVVLLLFWFGALACSFLPLASVRSENWWWSLSSAEDITEFLIWLLMTCCVTGAFVLGLVAPGLPKRADAYTALQSEQPSDAPTAHWESSWTRGYRRFKIVAPFIWPHEARLVQLRVVICVALLAIERVINVYTPVFYKRIIDSLTSPTNGTHVNLVQATHTDNLFQRIVSGLFGANGLLFRWDLVLEFMGLRFLQGLGGFGGGLIAALRSLCWVAVDQYSSRELSVKLFAHLHSLSLQWHLSRKTGEMLRIMDRGTASISNVLSYMVFNILPTVLDITIGVVYFVTVFNVWYGLLVLVTMTIYMGSTMAITEWRTKFRREMNQADNRKSTKAVDALLNFETVKYFNAEQFETDRFKQAFHEYQRFEWLTQFTLNLLNCVQNVIITLGMLVGTMLCARDVVLGRLTVGDFVLFNTYILQLWSPLNLFGTYYRLLQTSMIDMENMFELMEVNRDVEDDPDAPDLQIAGGEIEFQDVCFHYSPDRPILKHISFRVPAGRTVALVGQSGAGKSTIVRLLFRFYDVVSGAVLIDKQNVAHLKNGSLRRAIGVVPQDTVLFNDTVKYNIRYGRRDATDDEVRQAAISADIHERILEFPQNYDALVGERGLKLSGGEKQRVAIARNFLKNPQILLLDEATSALDTATERTIQASLHKIARNRTTLIVAHRLSTIVHADEILMMHQGEIVERGTHAQLLAIPGGRYAALWRAQSEARSTVDQDAIAAASDQNRPGPQQPTTSGGPGPVNV